MFADDAPALFFTASLFHRGCHPEKGYPSHRLPKREGRPAR
jgi:hypothetical protein